MRTDAATVIDRLERAMQRLSWAIVECEPADLGAAPGPGEWSPIEILAHLKACDDSITLRVALILTHPQPVLQRFDERAWAEIAGYTAAPPDQTLLAYQRHRQETVWQLRRLPDDAWDCTAQHEDRGPVTLLQVLASLVEHEEEHVAQLRELLGIEEDE